MKTLTKKERRLEQLERHYAFLERLSTFLGKKQDGKKLSLKLLKLEREANKTATDYCNGLISSDVWEDMQDGYKWAVYKLFASQPIPGLIINGDARGYTLKIDEQKVRNYYPQEIGFYRDMGGYGVLSPEIE